MPKMTEEEQRSAARVLHIKKVTKKASQLFQRAYSIPETVTNQEEFTYRWLSFENGLLDTFGQQKDIRRAFNTGRNLLDKLCGAYSWPYSPPSTLITHSPEKQSRNKTWLNHAWNTYDIYHDWRETHLNAKTEKPKLRYQSLILSLIFESGQTYIDVIRAFSSLLSKGKPIKLQGFKHYTYITLTLDNTKLNTNSYVNGEAITQYHCYLSTQTLAQLNLWRKTKMGHFKIPTDVDAIYRAASDGMPQKGLPATFNGFCSVGSMWYERHVNTYLSQALIEHRVGRNQSYSIPNNNLSQLINGFCLPVKVSSFTNFHINIQTSRPELNNQVETSHPPKNLVGYARDLKQAFKNSKDGKKLTKSVLKERLIDILDNDHILPWQTCFIKWLLHKFQTCSANSLRGYYRVLIKDWIMINTDQTLDSKISTGELEQIYLEQVNRHHTPKSKSYFSARLKDLHSFCIDYLNLPVLSEQFFNFESGQKHTQAGLVSESIFRAMLSHIQRLEDLNRSDILALQTLCILCYRCGLRPAEACKIQMKNLSHCRSVWIEVRTNHFGENKTASSTRKVPLLPLLLSHEKEIVEQYLRNKRAMTHAKTTPFLTMGSSLNIPMDQSTATRYISQFLKAASGLEYLVCYHLRHSCLSRLQLMLELDKPQETFPNFYPYEEIQHQDIKKLLFKSSQTKGYWEIAQFAGHEDPAMTFKHYFHLSDLLAAPPAFELNVEVSKKEAMVAGLSSRRKFDEIYKKEDRFCYGDAFSMLADQLSVNWVYNQENETKADHFAVSLLPDTNRQFSIELCHQILDAISKGVSFDDIAFKYRLDQTTINKWLTNAKYLASLEIKSSNPAFMGKKRHIHHVRNKKLTPGRLLHASELNYLSSFNKKLRSYYSVHKEQFIEQVEYSLEHVSIGKSGITFSDPKSLTNFIDTFSFAIPKSHWRAMTLYFKSSRIKYEWKDALQGIKTKVEVSGVKSGRTGHGSVRLELVSPNEKTIIKGTEMSKHSSHLLIYLVYFTFIMVANTRTHNNV